MRIRLVWVGSKQIILTFYSLFEKDLFDLQSSFASCLWQEEEVEEIGEAGDCREEEEGNTGRKDLKKGGKHLG